MLNLDDFNVIQSDSQEQWIRLSEINEMINQNILMLDKEKLEQYKKQTREIVL